MATTNDLKNGMVLKLDGQLWSVVWFQHHKPGKGGAVVRTGTAEVMTPARRTRGPVVCPGARWRVSRSRYPVSRIPEAGSVTIGPSPSPSVPWHEAQLAR